MAEESQKATKLRLNFENVLSVLYGPVVPPDTKGNKVFAFEIFVLAAYLILSSYNIFSAVNDSVLFIGTILYSARNATNLYKRLRTISNERVKMLVFGILLVIAAINLVMAVEFFTLETIDILIIQIPALILYICLFVSDSCKIFKEFYKIAD